VSLVGARSPTAVSSVSWASIKEAPRAKVARVSADTVIADLLAVRISHDGIQPYSRDSLLVPDDGGLDFIIEGSGLVNPLSVE